MTRHGWRGHILVALALLAGFFLTTCLWTAETPWVVVVGDLTEPSGERSTHDDKTGTIAHKILRQQWPEGSEPPAKLSWKTTIINGSKHVERDELLALIG